MFSQLVKAMVFMLFNRKLRPIYKTSGLREEGRKFGAACGRLSNSRKVLGLDTLQQFLNM